MSAEQNRDRLLRAIRCLQLIQRTNAPASSIAKAAGKALVPLLKEQAELPPIHSLEELRAAAELKDGTGEGSGGDATLDRGVQ